MIMYGTHDEELMRSAAFWAGKSPAASGPTTTTSMTKITSRLFGNALEPEELNTRNMGHADEGTLARQADDGKAGRPKTSYQWALA
jgi:type IV secretion system protein VirD4